MPSIKIKSKVLEIGEVKEYGSNGFKKLEVKIETVEEYPQKLNVNFIKDKADIFFNSATVNQVYELECNIKGREYKDRIYMDLECWRFGQGEATAGEIYAHEVATGDLPDDDLPF